MKVAECRLEKMRSVGREERSGRGKWRLTSRCLYGAIRAKDEGRQEDEVNYALIQIIKAAQ